MRIVIKDFPAYFQRYHKWVNSKQFQCSLIEMIVSGSSSLDLEISLLIPIFNMMSCEAMLLYHGLGTKLSGIEYWLSYLLAV